MRVLRHEILHAFIFECGLDTENSWARNEEMIEFFALQSYKIATVFSAANIIHLGDKLNEVEKDLDELEFCCSNDN